MYVENLHTMLASTQSVKRQMSDFMNTRDYFSLCREAQEACHEELISLIRAESAIKRQIGILC